MKKRIIKVYATLPGIQDRKALAWIPPYITWPSKYKIRAGFGMNFADFNDFEKPEWHYTYQGKHYWIKRDKAIKVAIKTGMSPTFPETVPLEEWNSEIIPVKVEYEIDTATNTAYVKGTRPEPKEPEKPKQESLL